MKNRQPKHAQVRHAVYLPPFALLSRVAHIKIENGQIMSVSMSGKAFSLLLGALMDAGLFDAEEYSARYPDVARAVREGTVPSARAHFLNVGYVEGRMPSDGALDEDWYTRENPDVARAVTSGEIVDGVTHYIDGGYQEGRAANAGEKTLAEAWQALSSRVD